MPSPPRPAPAAPPEHDARPRPDSSAPKALLRPALQEWERVVRYVREREPGLGVFLEYAVPHRVAADRVVIAFPEGSFYGRKVDAPAPREAIASAVEALLGGRPDIEVRFDATASDAERTVAQVEAKRRDAEVERKRREAMNHPLVQDALEVFPEARGQVEVQIETD